MKIEKYEILKKLVSFDTINDKENKKIIDYIEKILINLGFKTEYKTKVLVMSIRENAKLGFLGHTDTVECIEDFKNPFKVIEKKVGERLENIVYNELIARGYDVYT